MKPIPSKWPMYLGAGLVAGAAIVYVDNCAFEGEVSPLVIVVAVAGRDSNSRGHVGSERVDRSSSHVGVRTLGSHSQASPRLARHAAPEHVYLDPVSGSVHAGGRHGRHRLRSPGPQA